LALIPQVESIPWNRCQVSKIFKNSASVPPWHQVGIDSGVYSMKSRCHV